MRERDGRRSRVCVREKGCERKGKEWARERRTNTLRTEERVVSNRAPAGSIVLLREAGRSLSLSHAALIAYRSLIYLVGGGVSEREGSSAGGRETFAVCRSAGERQTDRKEQETQRKKGEKQVENRACWSAGEAASRKPLVRCRRMRLSSAAMPGYLATGGLRRRAAPGKS